MIETTEIDGVPALFVRQPGQLVAGLTFRVGMADETLPTRGITHLVEHLALHTLGLGDYHHNGTTGMTHTSFVARGSSDDVVDYMTAVCGGLTRPPVERLESERQILRTEEAGRQQQLSAELDLWRFGAQGHGLAAFPEWGLYRLTGDDVLGWVHQRFVRQNAVMWIAGDRIPSGLRLRLPEGRRLPSPTAVPVLPTGPAFFTGPAGAVMFDGLVKPTAAATITAAVLERRLFQDLRQRDSNSYTTLATFRRRGGGSGSLTAVADALADKQDAVLGGFVDVLAQLKAGRIDTADVETVRRTAIDQLAEPDAEAARLPTVAARLLDGEPITDARQHADELAAVQIEDVHHTVTEALRTALLQVPAGHSADWAGYDSAQPSLYPPVTGTTCPPRGHDGPTLVIGADGVTLRAGETAVTVPYNQCAAVLAWPDGGRRLIALDGGAIELEPTLYKIDPALPQHVDRCVGPARTIPLPPRDPQQIPQPQRTAVSERASAAHKPRKRAYDVPAMVIFGIAAVFWGLVCLASTLDPTESDPLAVTIFVLLVFYGIEAALIFPMVKIWRRRSR